MQKLNKQNAEVTFGLRRRFILEIECEGGTTATEVYVTTSKTI